MYHRNAEQLPLLGTYDVAIFGGSLAGIGAALALAQAGLSVGIFESRTYLAREIMATLRPWIEVEEKRPSSLPKVIRACIAGGAKYVEGAYLLHPDTAKRQLENLLLAAGIDLLYLTYPVGLITTESGTLQGCIVASKTGRQRLEAKMFVDATKTGLLARLGKCAFEPGATTRTTYRRTLEFTHVGTLAQTNIEVPEDLRIDGRRVHVRPGLQGERHRFVEYAFVTEAPITNLEQARALEVEAMKRDIHLAEYLINRVPSFEFSQVAAASYESQGPFTTPLASFDQRWVNEIGFSAVRWPEAQDALTLADLATPIPALICLSEAARLPERCANLFQDPVPAASVGTRVGKALAEHWPAICDFASSAKPATNPIEDIDAIAKEDADVLVVGGGSSGAVASITTASQGLRTILVDLNPGLGGTGTFGGINTYWFARRIGFVSRLMDWLDEMHDRLRRPRPQGVMAHWNIMARVWALGEKALEKQVSLYTNTCAFDALMDDEQVRGVVAATLYGPIALKAQVTIDATGDGDVAAAAGAPSIYGSEREHVVMWGYLPQIIDPGNPRNSKTGMVDISDVRDYTRMILAERRRGMPQDYDHGVYLAPRESRHIIGDVVLTLTDQLVKRAWPDVVYIAFSNYDMKGEPTSDWVGIGFQPPNLEIEIPYRALIPKAIESLIVCGKAYSATHDALAAPRMQPDLENLGGVAAMAAVQAIREGCLPRDVNLRALQAKLVDLGVLPKSILDRKLIPLQLSNEEIKERIATLRDDMLWHDYSNQPVGERFEGRVVEVDLMCQGPRIVLLLEQALKEATGRRKAMLARMLCALGSKKGVPVLIEELNRYLANEELPGRDHEIRHIGLPPDQGGDPEPAHLLYALGLARDARVLPIWQRTVDLLSKATKEQVFDRYRDLYAYAAAFLYGAERLGDPKAIPILQQLHSYPLFSNHLSTAPYEADIFDERLAHLEVVTGRALARCGSAEGYAILIDYLRDSRLSLASHAHDELVRLSGRDYGQNREAWRTWLQENRGQLTPCPYLEPTEPQRAWQENLLVAEGEI